MDCLFSGKKRRMELLLGRNHIFVTLHKAAYIVPACPSIHFRYGILFCYDRRRVLCFSFSFLLLHHVTVRRLSFKLNEIHRFSTISSKSNLFFFFFLIVHWGPIVFVVDYFQWCLWCLFQFLDLPRTCKFCRKKPFSIHWFYCLTQDCKLKQFEAINDLNLNRK